MEMANSDPECKISIDRKWIDDQAVFQILFSGHFWYDIVD